MNTQHSDREKQTNTKAWCLFTVLIIFIIPNYFIVIIHLFYFKIIYFKLVYHELFLIEVKFT